jgi:hypothetical protein
VRVSIRIVFILLKPAITVVTATAQLFWLFRLFKPGCLRAGETFIVQFQRGDECWETISSGRAATTSVDYQRLALKSTPYEFSSSELSFFESFKESLGSSPFSRAAASSGSSPV